MFVLFILLIVGPIIASKFITVNISILDLQQPSNWKNNDTLGASQTGSGLPNQGAAATASSLGGGLRRSPNMFTYGS